MIDRLLAWVGLERIKPPQDHPHLVHLLADPTYTGAARRWVEDLLAAWRRGDTCSKGCRECAAGVCFTARCGHDDCRPSRACVTNHTDGITLRTSAQHPHP